MGFFPGKPAIIGFVLGLCGWGYILSEIFTGEAGQIAGGADMNKFVASSFKTMRFIVTVGWSIYPLGYFFGYLCGSVDSDALNLVYNLADFVNKIAFCLAIWACAKSSTLEKMPHGRAQMILTMYGTLTCAFVVRFSRFPMFPDPSVEGRLFWL